MLNAVVIGALLAGSFGVVSPESASAAWPSGVQRVKVSAERISGRTRFDTAAAVARKAFPGWLGAKHVVIANGEDRALSDPLAAAALAWAYEAPLLLTEAGELPAATRSALGEIASVNSTVTVHVVGGTRSVPAARLSDIRAAIGSNRVEQPWTAGSRYDLARGIALRVAQVAQQTGRTVPDAVFLANGADADKYFDALSLSSVSAATGVPILLTARDTVPDATARALRELSPREVIAAGGEKTISAIAFRSAGGTTRWWGRSRYSTSTAIANSAIYRGWLKRSEAGLVAARTDAAAASVLTGRKRAPLLVTDGTSLRQETAAYLSSGVSSCLVLGGPLSVSAGVMAELGGAPGKPTFLSPDGLVAGKARVKVRAGVNTTVVTLFSGTTRVGVREVSPYSTVDFGLVSMPASGSTLRAVAGNPDGGAGEGSRRVTRLSYPWPTGIVVDKSDFRLYWIKDHVLVADYPVAHGRNGWTPVATWKILSKYYPDPSSVYGPRKMRLYRKVGSSYVYTAYAIHGTNNAASIGTLASAGCIRMYNEDVLELFPQVPLGTLVQTRE
jgi:lipoprotein-anchoring transpeptidase ErfK/SrfK